MTCFLKNSLGDGQEAVWRADEIGVRQLALFISYSCCLPLSLSSIYIALCSTTGILDDVERVTVLSESLLASELM